MKRTILTLLTLFLCFGQLFPQDIDYSRKKRLSKSELTRHVQGTRDRTGEYFYDILHHVIDWPMVHADSAFVDSLNDFIPSSRDIAEIRHPFWLGEDIFPLEQLVYVDTAFNNISGTNCIYITNVSATNNKATVTVNWLPYRTTLIHPVDTLHCWAALCTNTWEYTSTEPNRTGDATEIVRIDSANYSNKYLYCTYMNYGGTFPLATGDTLIIYNPFGGRWEWCDSALVVADGDGWNETYVSPGPTWLHSDGSLRMLINGYSDTEELQRVGLVKVSVDSIFDTSAWHILNNDNPVIDTCIAKNRGSNVVASSVLKSYTVDGYIVYIFCHNSGDPWMITYIIMDEDGNIIEDPGTDIISTKPSTYDGSASMGLSAPSVVRYGSKYLMLLCNRDDANSISGLHDRWSIFEATSYNERGPFVCGTDSIFARAYNNKLSYRSGYTDIAYMFPYKGHIYAFISGTSIWHQSGSKGNRWWGFAYRNERDENPTWVEDPRSPLWINIMQKYYNWTIYPGIWGEGTGADNQYFYSSDHSGGYPSFFSNEKDGYIYLFISSSASSDNYRVWGMRLDSMNF